MNRIEDCRCDVKCQYFENTNVATKTNTDNTTNTNNTTNTTNCGNRKFNEKKFDDKRNDTDSRAGIIVKRADNGKYLLVENSASRGKIGFPSGHVKKNESTIRAAVRELKEETGLDIPIGKYEFIKFSVLDAMFYFVILPVDDCDINSTNFDDVKSVGWYDLNCAAIKRRKCNAVLNAVIRFHYKTIKLNR